MVKLATIIFTKTITSTYFVLNIFVSKIMNYLMDYIRKIGETYVKGSMYLPQTTCGVSDSCDYLGESILV